MTKHKALLETLHKTARGLRDAGRMSAQTMREFDVLCLPKIKEYCPAQTKRMRERTINRVEKPGLAQIGCITRNVARRWRRQAYTRPGHQTRASIGA
jgi:putative transcriptional regulator